MGITTSIKAASLSALILFFAIGAHAADSEIIYKAGFAPQAPFGGDVGLRLQNNAVDPLLVIAEDMANRKFSVRFERDHKNIDLLPRPVPFQVSSLMLYYLSNSGNDQITRTRVLSGGRRVDGNWDLPILMSTGLLLDVTDSLSSYRVGASDTHTVAFTTSTNPLSDSGIIWIVFPSGFNIDSVAGAIYADDDPTNDGSEPSIHQIGEEGQALLMHLTHEGQQAVAGSRIWLKFWPIVNDTVAGGHSVLVMSTHESGEIQNGPTASQNFYLVSDSLDHITVSPDTAATVLAGSILNFAASGYDRYGNPISGLSFDYDVTVDSCGQVTDGNFRGGKLGQCYVTASANGLMDSTGLITVVPGALTRFAISNYPSSRTAGIPFPDTVFVTAFDSEGNKKYDYLGQVWFSTSDTIDVLPYKAQNPYTFTVADAGGAKFPGSGFILKRAGINRTIMVTNGTIGQTTSPIRITAAAISAFSMAADTSQIAGQAFPVSVTNARDAYGNPASGTITVSDSSGGGNSPDGIPPSYNQVVVTDGAGSALQTVTNAVRTRLKGVTGSARANTAEFRVLPGTLGRFNLARYPDIIVAGEIFPQTVVVTAKDLFGNIKTNYLGSVYFTSTDTRAVLPYILGSSYPFNQTDQGVHEFNESFSLLTTGRQYITVTDGIIEAESDAINVSPDLMTSFNLTAPDSVGAGQPFALSISNARDQWGNPANGVITVSDSSGGGVSPGGIPPTFNQIVVDSGSGQAMQTLTNAEPTRLKAVLEGGNLRQATGLIQVRPGVLARFSAVGYPDEIGAGEIFPDSISVLVFDPLGNLKTDFDDSVYFECTDTLAVLPYAPSSPFHFQRQYLGRHVFHEPFTLYTAGRQRITLTNGIIGTPSDYITVLPDNINAFNLSAPDTVMAGQPFSLAATDVRDQWGNPADGVIAVSDSVGGGPSPGGNQPTLNQIVISNGAGQAQQLLTNAVPTRLKGVYAGVAVVTDTIIVVPGSFSQFSMAGIPTSTVAGDTFPGSVTVTAYDPFSNIKTNYNGVVYFESTDPQAILPFRQGTPYQFQPQDQGAHSFGGPFSLITSGWRRITATNGAIGITSDAIEVLPDVMTEFTLTAPDSVTAGQSFLAVVSNAIDQWDNPANGIIAISDSVGGGASPDGSQPSFSQITVTAGSGQALQILTNAVPTRLRGALTGGGNVRAATPLFQVRPGALGRFEASGYPDSTVAGDIFPPGITVSVFDLFGNPKSNFDDFVYFTSTDPQALLPYTQSTPFHFLRQFGGTHVFNEQFSLRSSGSRFITFTNGTRQASSPPIQVAHNLITAFTLSAPSGIMAGQPFAATVSGAHDVWNNPAGGIVVISDSVGGGPSPNGTAPIFNPIQVSSGSGSASQTLFNVTSTVLRGAIGPVVRATDPIGVTPASLGSFNFELSSPQFEGNPFLNTALVTAFDTYGNLKTNNNAVADTVVITSSAGGTMENNILRSAGDFVNGVADLAARGTTFYGRGGQMSFRAASQSGVSASTGTIEMNAMQVQSLNISQENVRNGDSITGNVSVANFGGVYLEVTAIDIIDSIGNTYSYTLNPTLPYIIAPGQTRAFDFSFVLVPAVPLGIHPITVGARGIYSTPLLDTALVVDTMPGFPDRFNVTAGSRPVYIAGTLYPETLSTGSTYAFAMRLGNAGNSEVSLYDSSHFTFTDGIHNVRANLAAPLYLAPHDSIVGVIASFDPITLDPDFVPGDYSGTFRYFGTEDGLFRSGVISIPDFVWVERRAALAYLPGSLNIDSLAAGQRVAFSIRVNNSGTADFILNHQDTRLTIGDGVREYIALSDTSSGNRTDIIHQGDTTFHFARVVMPFDFAPGQYRPNVVISGFQNGHPEVVSFTTADTVKVLSPAAVRIDSTLTMSYNAPLVNTGQACSVWVEIESLGDEAAESLYVHLDHNGYSVFPDSIYVPRLSGHQMIQLMFQGSAASSPNQGEVFTSSVIAGRGAVSRDPAAILQPLDNTALLVIETPAALAISPITVVGPPEAMDDTISTGQEITISATVRNFGQAGITEIRRLFLNPGTSGWEDIDSLTRDFQLGQPVTWNLTAPPNATDSAALLISFANRVYDLNDSSNAVGPDSLSSIVFVVDSRPFITHAAAISEPPGAVDGEVSTNQIFVISDTLTANGLYDTKAVRIHLPAGFTTDDSLVKFPEGDVASWHLRAPATAGDATIMLSSWIYDRNIGDSIGTLPRYIDVSTVRAASLAISSRILGPATALDGILQPGGQFQFEAVVRNNGVAAVGSGRVRLMVGHPDMIPSGNPIRDFTAGESVIWTISAPASEVSMPIPISAVILDVPDEDNTGQPAAVAADSAAITVMIRELYPKIVLNDISGHLGSVYKGQQLQFVTFELLNNDLGGNFPVGVSGFTFDVVSNPALDASELISGATVSSGATSSAFAGFDEYRFSVDLADTVYIDADGRAQFTLALAIRPDTPVRDFSIYVADDFVEAYVIENGIAAQALQPVLPRGEPVSWQSDPTAVVAQSFAASLSSYPNPFSPRDGGTRIGYYLPSATGLEIRIFTMLGDLVWTKIVPASDPLGGAGLHTGETALIWNGKNDIGNEIRSGVYICIIINLSSGEEEKFKIAVVK